MRVIVEFAHQGLGEVAMMAALVADVVAAGQAVSEEVVEVALEERGGKGSWKQLERTKMSASKSMVCVCLRTWEVRL